METKKVQLAEAESSFNAGKVRDFVGDIKTEIGKVNWTSPEELKVYTKIVVGATFALGIGIYCADLVIQAVLSSLEILIRIISG